LFYKYHSFRIISLKGTDNCKTVNDLLLMPAMETLIHSLLVVLRVLRAAMGQWVTGPSFNQGIGGSIPTLVDVSLSEA